MDSVKEARGILAETLAWLLYGGSREVATWAADAGWLLVAYELIPREEWHAECLKASEWRAKAFSGHQAVEEREGDAPSSPRL